MPTYQYACTACGHQLEAVQSFTDDAADRVPGVPGQAAQAVLVGGHRVQGLRLLPHRLPAPPAEVVGRLVIVQRRRTRIPRHLRRHSVRFVVVQLVVEVQLVVVRLGFVVRLVVVRWVERRQGPGGDLRVLTAAPERRGRPVS